MKVIEKVVRNVKGEEKVVDFLFGSGRLTANPPEIREVNGGYKVMRGFGFSIKFSNGKNKKPDYYPIELWGSNAENMARLGFEGQLVEVAGRLEKQTYKKDGEDKEITVLVVERFTCLEYKPKNEENPTTSESQEYNDVPSDFSNPTNPLEDDIPF
jgi:single-strand DNA-binding protein